MVTFKEIEMTGFKSFADTTKINFDGGITAIVGPNGCGKSNVSDAIRWVLGEQSSKALRGKSMQDVIFAGTEKRKKLSYCEVSLVFDNTNKWFNVEYDEVVITRKLYRSGESDYLINKKPCRLKDIRDILYDSGIGKDGYSIIGQGRVEEIIQSKPEERRNIFEEAAGIAKYKARKVETENRLERVRDNLSRANDILTEVERRLGPLKKQSEDAKHYLEYRDILKNLEINAYIYQYDHTASTKQEINLKLQGYRDNLNVLNNALETEQAKYDKTLNEIDDLDQKSKDLHEEILQNSLALEKQQSKFELLNEQTKHLKDQVDRLQNDINSLSQDRADRLETLNRTKEEKDKETESLKQLHSESQRIMGEYMTLIDELTKNEGEKEENQRNIIDNLAKLTDIKANLSGYKAKRDTLNENINQDNTKLESTVILKNSVVAKKNELELIVNKLKEQKAELDKQNENKLNLIRETKSQINELNDKIFALKSSIYNDNNRKTILSNLQADFEGYQFAVKRLMQESKQDSSLNSLIKGVVGNIVSTDEKYSLAIEIALGGSIQNIVTKNEEDAKQLIGFLKDRKLGRATFLPISAVKPRVLGQEYKRFLTSTGVLGVASDLVKYDIEFKPVIDSLLGATVVCDNLDNAVKLAKTSGFSFRIVTLEGDVLSPQGSMSGGSKKSNDSTLLNKEAEIKALEQNIITKTNELNVLSNRLAELNNKLTALNNDLNALADSLNQLNTDFYTNNSKLDSLNNNITSLDEEIFSIKSRMKVARDIVVDLENKINSIDKVEQDYVSTQSKVGEFNESNKNTYIELKLRRDEYAEKNTTIKVQIASKEERIISLNKEIETQMLEIESLDLQIEKMTKEFNSERKMFEEAINISKSKEDQVTAERIKNKLSELNTKLSQFEDFRLSLKQELKVIDDKRNEISNNVTHMNNKIFQEETRLQKVDLDLENMQERIYEEYEMTYQDCLPFKNQGEDYSIRDSLIEINKVKNKITALGYVNVNAIEEYKTEGARYEGMNAQITDLKQAEEDAVKIIKDLSNEMMTQFNTEFSKIQENFTKVFKELFGGGNARLELLPSDDPLTAGVDIIAQPPGKVLSNITLLSGGEKTMTAIAILFAILKLKPMPFCFLDEIEAALDDANIERYAQYLKRFSNETQFIVITHRKPTMEVVDSLYGVTMEEKGVSKIVSVKLQDAVKVSSEENPQNKG